MNRSEYFRDKYEKWWPVSVEREKKIQGMLEKYLGTTVEPYGMGALSTQRITGSARENGFEPADPDFYVPEFDCFFEVTGPIPLYIHLHDVLFVNPKKVRNARQKYAQGHQTWLIHVLDRKGVRQQLMSLTGDALSPELRELIANFCLTEKARCKLGRLCARVESGKASKEELVRNVELLHKKRNLISPQGDEKSIIRCFLMDEDFAQQFSENTTSFGGETFVQVPHDWQGIVSFRRMAEMIKGQKR